MPHGVHAPGCPSWCAVSACELGLSRVHPARSLESYAAKRPPQKIAADFSTGWTGRPGADMKPVSLTRLQRELQEKYQGMDITYRDVLSAALYPQVFNEYM